MYRCNSCGELFETPIGWLESLDDPKNIPVPYCGCPYCKEDDYIEVIPCKCCGEYHDPEKMHFGICDDCLKSAADMAILKEYLIEEPKALADFVFCEVLHTGFDRYEVDQSLKDFTAAAFDWMVENGEITLDMVQDYVLDDNIDKDDFADWLLERRENNG